MERFDYPVFFKIVPNDTGLMQVLGLFDESLPPDHRSHQSKRGDAAFLSFLLNLTSFAIGLLINL